MINGKGSTSLPPRPLILALLLLGCRSVPEGASTVRSFDIDRYLGTWYEITRTDNRSESGLSNVSATYSRSEDGTI